MSEYGEEKDRLQRITIHSPLGNSTLTNVSINDIYQAAEKEMQHLHDTSFFSKIIGHFAVQRNSNLPHFSDYYNSRLLTVMEETRITERFMQKIFESMSEEELKGHEERYQQEIFAEKLKSEMYVKSLSTKYEPCLYFEVEKKHQGYFNFSQQFTSRGYIELAGKVGRRANIFPHDTIEFNYSSQPALLNRGYSQLSLEWANRIRKGSYFVKGCAGTNQLYRDIDYSYKNLQLGFMRHNQLFQVQASIRSPSLFSHIPAYCKLNYHLPSTKLSLKYKKILQNSLKTKEITTGTYSQVKTQVGFPFLASARFFKLQYLQKRYFDIYWMSQDMQSKRLKYPCIVHRKLLYNSSLERTFNAACCLNYSKHSSPVDFLDNIAVRGFDKGNTPIETLAQVKSSLKFNIHNYPILHQGYLVPFFFAQAGFALVKDKTIVPHAMGSTGIGLGFAISPSFKVELLSTFFSLQSTPLHQPIRFQIRFSLND